MGEFERDELIFWRNVPVDVERGAFEYISKNWGKKVIFSCYSDYSTERKQCEWDADGLQQIILENHSKPDKTIEEIFDKYPNVFLIRTLCAIYKKEERTSWSLRLISLIPRLQYL